MKSLYVFGQRISERGTLHAIKYVVAAGTVLGSDSIFEFYNVVAVCFRHRISEQVTLHAIKYVGTLSTVPGSDYLLKCAMFEMCVRGAHGSPTFEDYLQNLC